VSAVENKPEKVPPLHSIEDVSVQVDNMRGDMTGRADNAELLWRSALAVTLLLTGVGFVVGDLLARMWIAGVLLIASSVIVIKMWPLLIWLDKHGIVHLSEHFKG